MLIPAACIRVRRRDISVALASSPISAPERSVFQVPQASHNTNSPPAMLIPRRMVSGSWPSRKAITRMMGASVTRGERTTTRPRCQPLPSVVLMSSVCSGPGVLAAAKPNPIPCVMSAIMIRPPV